MGFRCENSRMLRSPDLRTKSQRQMASPNSSSINCSCASGSPLLTHLARPFRIMWTACNVRHTVEKDWYPLASHTRFFETRWSCSTTLFKYLHCRSRQRRRSVPSTLSSSTAGGYARFLSTLITRSWGLAGSSNVLRKNRLAAAASRLVVSRESMVCREIHGPIQISVLPFDPDINFIDAIAFIGALQVSAAALVEFRP